MTIHENRFGTTLTVALEGRLDTLSAPELETYLERNCPSADKLILDLEWLEYISSAGLRVILKAQKAMQDREGVLIRHANRLVMGVFHVTGFVDLFDFEA